MRRVLLINAVTLSIATAGFAQQTYRFLSGGVLLPHEDAQMGDVVAKSFQKALSTQDRVSLISSSEITQWKSKQANHKTDGQENTHLLADARNLLAEGKNLYQNIKYEEALVRLLRARKQFILSLHLMKSNRDLIEAHLYLGLTFAALKETEKANEEFKRVVYLDPKRELTGKEFPPHALNAFAKARQDVMGTPESQVEIVTPQEGADVYLNGRLAGQTPLNVKLHAGEYFILVEKGSSTPWFQTVSIQRSRERIEAMSEGAAHSVEADIFRVREGSDQSSEDLARLFELANGVQADFVVLGTVQKLGSYRLLGQLLDVKTGRFSQVSLAKMEKGLASFDQAALDTAHTLLAFIEADGRLAGDPKPNLNVPENSLGVGEPRQEDPPVLKPQKPWYRKWWIYPIIAGVGAAAYLGATQLGGKSGSKVIFDNSGN